MIYLDDALATIMRSRLGENPQPGDEAEYSRYTAKVDNDGSAFTVWAWVNNEPRKIGRRILT